MLQIGRIPFDHMTVTDQALSTEMNSRRRLLHSVILCVWLIRSTHLIILKCLSSLLSHGASHFSGTLAMYSHIFCCHHIGRVLLVSALTRLLHDNQ